MRFKEIKERGIGDEIIELRLKKDYTLEQIADKYNISTSMVHRYIREETMRNYSDENLEAIAMTDEFTPLNVIQHFFQSVQHASKELAFTAILNQMYREEIAGIIDREGILALSRGDNYEVLTQWHNNSKKLNKLIENAPKQLEAYINLFSQVLDVQKEVSYVKIVTDLLRKEDPVLYRKLQKALDADPEAKKVLDSLSREDVIMYWDTDTGKLQEIDASIEYSEVN